MLLDFEKLYAPYSKDAPLETTMLYFAKEAKNRGIPDDIRDAVIAEVFFEMANGKTFSVDSCSCSPDCNFNKIKWSSADMNHYTLGKMIAKDKELDKIRSEALLKGVNDRIISHMEEDNRKYLEESGLLNKTTWADRNIPTFKKWFTRK